MSTYMPQYPVPPKIQGSTWTDTSKTRILQADEINGISVSSISGWKGYANAATVSNIILSGIQTIDGVVLNAGDLILVKNQTDPIDNGIYVVKNSEWSRNINMIIGMDAAGSSIYIKSGTVNNRLIYVCTNSYGGGIVGVDGLIFSSIASVADPLTLSGLTVTGNSILSSANNRTTIIGSGASSTIRIGSGSSANTFIGSPTTFSNTFIGSGTNSYIGIGSGDFSTVTIGEGDGVNVSVAVYGITTINIGSVDSRIGFFGADAVTKRPAIVSPSADVDSLKIAVDNIINILNQLGLTL